MCAGFFAFRAEGRPCSLLLAAAALAVLAAAALSIIPRPAEAGHEAVWSATLTPQSLAGPNGCSNSSPFTARNCVNAFTDNMIELPDGTSIEVSVMTTEQGGAGWFLYFVSGAPLPAQIVNYAFEINGVMFRFDDPNLHRPLGDARQWPPNPAVKGLFVQGTPVEIKLVVAHPTVSISASPTTLDEGDPVTITVTLSRALSSRVNIPLLFYGFSAEPGDYTRLASITIPANSTSGTGTIIARYDADSHDDVFGVDLGTLPPEVVEDSPSSVAITIIDDDLPFGVTTVPGSGTGTGLSILPTDSNVQPVPASGRTPTGAGASARDGFCYTRVGSGSGGEGGGTDGKTEYVRSPDCRLVETTKQSEYIRSLYACD
jgi:hypothetical protein